MDPAHRVRRVVALVRVHEKELEAEVEQEDHVDDAVDDEEPINLTRPVDERHLDKGDDGREQESSLRRACNR